MRRTRLVLILYINKVAHKAASHTLSFFVCMFVLFCFEICENMVQILLMLMVLFAHRTLRLKFCFVVRLPALISAIISSVCHVALRNFLSIYWESSCSSISHFLDLSWIFVDLPCFYEIRSMFSCCCFYSGKFCLLALSTFSGFLCFLQSLVYPLVSFLVFLHYFTSRYVRTIGILS